MKKLVVLFLSMFLSMAFAFAQKNVTGKVVDEKGESLPGVNILVKGSSTGCITDVDGKFSLQVENLKQILSFSFIGYKSVEEPLNNRSELNIILFPDVALLDEVVTVGYNVVRKRDLTGSVGQVKSDDLAKSPVTNYDQALAGRVAGVQVSASDGTPGQGLNIVIRGGNSIIGNNSPLYVVDGIPLENFDPASISTSDIKDFDVLKDASATAIYGSRGANGVIIITTKKGGEDGKTIVTLGASLGVQRIPSRMEVMSPYDYVLYEQEVAYLKGAADIASFNEHWIDPELYRGVKGTSWQDKIFRNGVVQNYNLSLSGGDKKTNLYFSTDYMDQKGTLLNTGFKKINNNLKVNHRINQKVQVGGYMTYSFIKRAGLDISGSNRHSVILDAVTFRPVSPIVDDGRDGGINYDDNPNDLRFNPVKTLNNTDYTRRQDVVRANGFMNYDLNKKLRLKLSVTYQADNRKETVFYNKDTYQGTKGPDGINGGLTDRRSQSLSTSNTLTYKTKFAVDHDFTALAGFEAQANNSDYFNAKNSRFPIDDFGVDKIELGTVPLIPVSGASSNRLASFFGNINYGFKDRYLLTFNLRADGSSKFKSANRWGYFPSAAFAWRLIEEDFVKNLNLFSNLKLRAGYGVTGNNRVGDFDAFSLLDTDSYSGYVLGNKYMAGVYHSNLAAKDLKWESTAQINGGIDMAFLNNRITVVADVYRKNTKDLLLYAELTPSVGYNQMYRNVGEVQNQGVELSINTVNIDGEQFKWMSSFNISFNRNKTIALSSGQDAMYTNPDWYQTHTEYQYITRVGEPVGLFYGLKANGVYQMEDFDFVNGSYVLKAGLPNNGARVAPGSAKFHDLNNDGTINEKDRTVIGSAQPKHFGGFTNDFKFKNFDCQVFLQWSFGNEILNANRVWMENPTNVTGFNYLASVADRWQSNNPSNNIHGIYFGGVYGNPPKGNYVSDQYVEDGSYLRLKTVSVGYSLGRKMLNRLKLKGLRVYMAGQNLYTFTNYSGYDPEVSVGKYGALTPGLDYSAYPTSMTIMGGIEIKL